MRVTLIVFAGLLLVIAAGIGGILGGRNLSDASKIEEMKDAKALVNLAASAGSQEGKMAKDIMERGGQLKTGAIPAFLTAVLALVLFILVFVKRGVALTASGILLTSIVSVLLNPNFDTGKYGPASPRSIAIALACFGVFGALSAFGAEQIRRRRAA
jgi:hypothetical protein